MKLHVCVCIQMALCVCVCVKHVTRVSPISRVKDFFGARVRSFFCLGYFTGLLVTTLYSIELVMADESRIGRIWKEAAAA
jgi:hypothetical protein